MDPRPGSLPVPDEGGDMKLPCLMVVLCGHKVIYSLPMGHDLRTHYPLTQRARGRILSLNVTTFIVKIKRNAKE